MTVYNSMAEMSAGLTKRVARRVTDACDLSDEVAWRLIPIGHPRADGSLKVRVFFRQHGQEVSEDAVLTRAAVLDAMSRMLPVDDLAVEMSSVDSPGIDGLHRGRS